MRGESCCRGFYSWWRPPRGAPSYLFTPQLNHCLWKCTALLDDTTFKLLNSDNRVVVSHSAWGGNFAALPQGGVSDLKGSIFSTRWKMCLKKEGLRHQSTWLHMWKMFPFVCFTSVTVQQENTQRQKILNHALHQQLSRNYLSNLGSKTLCFLDYFLTIFLCFNFLIWITQTHLPLQGFSTSWYAE